MSVNCLLFVYYKWRDVYLRYNFFAKISQNSLNRFFLLFDIGGADECEWHQNFDGMPGF